MDEPKDGKQVRVCSEITQDDVGTGAGSWERPMPKTGPGERRALGFGNILGGYNKP